MFSDFWFGLAQGSADLLPDSGTGSAAIDGVLALPSYLIYTLSGGAAIFGS